MALIENAKGRRPDQPPSGYTRLFGIEALGNLLSRVQGAVISAGNELETLIWERVTQIEDLDVFVATTIHQRTPGMFVARKQQVKKSKSINSRYEPDFVGFDLEHRICYVVEVKDGDQFDTKKAGSEYVTLHNFTNDISHALPFSTRIFICSFNATTKGEVLRGLKGRFAIGEVLTGREFCELFQIDYDEIRRSRDRDQERNLEFFVRELLRIEPLRSLIRRRLKADTEAPEETPPPALDVAPR